MELWEQIALGALAILILFLFRPGIKATIEKIKNAEETQSLSTPIRS